MAASGSDFAENESKDQIKSTLKTLMAKKDSMEAEIKALGEVLESQDNVGLDGPLVDNERYPRADIDVHSVRTARHNIICLQNDHKALMLDIEKHLHQLHAISKSNMMETDSGPTVQTGEQVAFVKVDKVDEGSPAKQAGLMSGDEITKFGSVTCDNYKNLQDIVTVVLHSVGSPVKLTIIRDGKTMNLNLTPNKWSGKGFLGCNVVPIHR